MFIYKGDNVMILDSVKAANSLHKLGDIYSQINMKENFDMSTVNPIHISDRLKMTINTMDIEIKIYKPVWRWSKAYGYYSHSDPFAINLNYYRIIRHKKLADNLRSLIGTYFHEAVHMADNFDQIHRYGHGDNSSNGKENTAPYWIGNMAASLWGGIKPDFNNVENKTYQKRRTFWQRIKRLLSKIF